MNQPLSALDILDLVLPGDVQVSPDGSQCAFVLVRMDRDENVQKASVWIVPTDGSAPARGLTSGPRRDSMPRWSPDGRWLAFLSNREAEWRADLYVIDLRGAEPRKVAQLPRGIEAYAWAPDSSHDDLDIVIRLDVRSRHRALTGLRQLQGDVVSVVQLEHHTLEIEKHIDDVFLHAI